MVALAPKVAKVAKRRWPTLIFWPPSLSLVQFLVLLLGKAQGGQPQKMSLPKVAKFYGVGHVGQ